MSALSAALCLALLALACSGGSVAGSAEADARAVSAAIHQDCYSAYDACREASGPGAGERTHCEEALQDCMAKPQAP